jgi:hypothetical protein
MQIDQFTNRQHHKSGGFSIVARQSTPLHSPCRTLLPVSPYTFPNLSRFYKAVEAVKTIRRLKAFKAFEAANYAPPVHRISPSPGSSVEGYNRRQNYFRLLDKFREMGATENEISGIYLMDVAGDWLEPGGHLETILVAMSPINSKQMVTPNQGIEVQYGSIPYNSKPIPRVVLRGPEIDSSPAPKTGDLMKVGQLGGELFPPEKLPGLLKYLDRRGIYVYEGINGSFDGVQGIMRLPRNPTKLNVRHELSHMLDYQKYGDDYYKLFTPAQREQMVLERLQNNRIWDKLNNAERAWSLQYPSTK